LGFIRLLKGILMNMQQAVVSVLSQYATFSGRAPRSEYWWYSLAVLLVSFFIAVLDALLFPTSAIDLSSLFALAVFVPGMAVSVRRLHDIDKSGWNLLWIFLPLVGIILLLYWGCQKGDVIDNDYGPNPLEAYED
jgi:uncharacterized membrane protein YhaH (DUF805 family)